MNLGILQLRPNLCTEDHHLLLRPAKSPRQERHEKSLQPDLEIHVIPVAYLFKVFILRPYPERPLQWFLDDVHEPDLLHDVLVSRRNVEGSPKREARLEEEVSELLRLGAGHGIVITAEGSVNILELEVAAGLEGAVGGGALVLAQEVGRPRVGTHS